MNVVKKIFGFYIDGFKNIDRLGIKLWIIIAIKLFSMFVILKIFFFPNFLNSKFETDKQKSDYIIKNLTKN